ncbi:MAG: polysaccharide pyruvyl transferase family protein [Muribaculaceae bacterium]|nr:polysaccharide pyruvyl transferase family protein [Muribaculaceae bacterium]
MKVAIVTHKLLHNYGGVLQAYALQKALRELGHNPIGIDCVPPLMSRHRYLLANIKTLCFRMIGKYNRKWISFPIEERKDFFKDFYNKYMALTPICKKYTYSVLKQIGAKAIIVGSDQVWRSSFYSDRGLYMDMFLRFALKFKGLKIAYAASFGIVNLEVSKKEQYLLQYLISKFTAISTRELSGVYLCKQHLKVDALHICDPTILLTRKDYMQLTEKPTYTDYIFGYILDIEPVTEGVIKKIAKQLGLQVRIEGAESSAYISIERWLGMIEGATAMITNSFHGTVFALITHTPFIVIAHEERGTERLCSLLNSLDLNERMVTDNVYIKAYMLKEYNIDWEKIDKKLETMRVVGKRFLEEALCGKTTKEIAQIFLREKLLDSLTSNL